MATTKRDDCPTEDSGKRARIGIGTYTYPKMQTVFHNAHSREYFWLPIVVGFLGRRKAILGHFPGEKMAGAWLKEGVFCVLVMLCGNRCQTRVCEE